jgi:hypothetical protein
MGLKAVSTLIMLAAFNADVLTVNKCMSIETVLLITSGTLMIVKTVNEE